jgi:hypothetical protein
MANHVRRQLREAVAAALTGLATTGSRVFASRVYPLQSAELPGLAIYTTSESAVEETIETDPTQRREIEVRVDACAAPAADLDDVLDQIAQEVEIALQPGVLIGSISVELAYEGAEISMSAEAAKPHGLCSMTFRGVLFTQSGAPDVLV